MSRQHAHRRHETRSAVRKSGLVRIESSLRALASDKRLQILELLKDPRKHFPPQIAGDLVRDGVCGLFIADKLRVTQPTVSEHLRILTQAGLIRGKRIKQWTFYKRDDAAIATVKRAIMKSV